MTMTKFVYRKIHSTITFLIIVSDYLYKNISKNMSALRSITGPPSLHQENDYDPICISQNSFDHHLSDKCFRVLVKNIYKKCQHCAFS